jgi:penicillin amidase
VNLPRGGGRSSARSRPRPSAPIPASITRARSDQGPLWQLVTGGRRISARSKFTSWEALVSAVDDAIDELTSGSGKLSDRSWGEFNRAIVAHPLGNALPLAGRWLNMPNDTLPGDIYAPRAHSPRAGPSERMVVSPGREAEGILHMPTGQSGHPLSPHYGDQHHAWLAATSCRSCRARPSRG